MLHAEAIHLPYGLKSGFELHISVGEQVAILGPNGAGKTTLIRLLAGLLVPSAGQILLAGKAMHSYSARARARQIAWVPQTSVTPFGFTVEALVAMGRHPYRQPMRGLTTADRAAVNDALASTGLTNLRTQNILTLSGGQQQRVVLARALAQTPKVLLLDEPTAHQDLAHRTAILSQVTTQAKARNLSCVAVLHDLNLAALYFPRLVLIAQGLIIADGSPAEVMTPSHLRAAFGIEVTCVQHPTLGVPQILAY